ncbi:MAG: EAL domain-containing protein, partial [Sphingobium sp.]
MKHMSFVNTFASAISAPRDLQSLGSPLPFPVAVGGVSGSFLQQTVDPVLILDPRGHVIWANEGALTRVNAMHIEASGRHWEQIWPSDHRSKVRAAFDAALIHGHSRFFAHILTDGEATWEWDVTLTRIPNSAQSSSHVIALAREVVPQQVSTGQLPRIEMLDILTGLPNRMYLHRQISRRISSHTSGDGPFALAILDVDGFKQLNCRLGQKACDALLIDFANHLALAAKDHIFVARSGGDEFALIIDAAVDAAQTVSRLESLTHHCANLISSSRDIAGFSVSAGVSLFPEDARTDQELIRNTRAALDAARKAARGRVLRFDGSMRQQLQRHSSMLEVARVAVASDWINPYYQPKVDLQTGNVVGLEALLRWQRPGGQVHLPASIVAAFDDPELAKIISETMLKKVLTDVVAWKRTGSTLPVAINASAADFRDPDFAGKLLDRLYKAEIPTHLLELEVTEGVFLDNSEADVGDALRQLNAAGVRISLDDFGTGYASLS